LIDLFIYLLIIKTDRPPYAVVDCRRTVVAAQWHTCRYTRCV